MAESSTNDPIDASAVERWLDQAQSGSAEALAELLNLFRPYLLAIANDAIGSELRAKEGASDVVQDTCIEAQRDFAQFQYRSKDELAAWLRTILRNNLRDLERRYRETDKRRLDREMSLGEAGDQEKMLQFLIDRSLSPPDELVREERKRQVREAVARLPDDYRTVIELRFKLGQSWADVAAAMNRSEQAVQKLAFRAVEQLKREIGGVDAP